MLSKGIVFSFIIFFTSCKTNNNYSSAKMQNNYFEDLAMNYAYQFIKENKKKNAKWCFVNTSLSNLNKDYYEIDVSFRYDITNDFCLLNEYEYLGNNYIFFFGLEDTCKISDVDKTKFNKLKENHKNFYAKYMPPDEYAKSLFESEEQWKVIICSQDTLKSKVFRINYSGMVNNVENIDTTFCSAFSTSILK